MASAQIFKTHLQTPFLILLIAEICVVYGSVYSVIFIRFYNANESFTDFTSDRWESAVVITLVTAITMMSTGLYVGRLREGMAGVLIRVAISLAMSSMIVGLIFYLLPELFLGRGILVILYVQSFFIIGTIRTLFFLNWSILRFLNPECWSMGRGPMPRISTRSYDANLIGGDSILSAMRYLITRCPRLMKKNSFD